MTVKRVQHGFYAIMFCHCVFIIAQVSLYLGPDNFLLNKVRHIMSTGPHSTAGNEPRLQIEDLGNKFYGHSPPSADPRWVVVSYKQKYVHEVLVYCFS